MFGSVTLLQQGEPAFGLAPSRELHCHRRTFCSGNSICVFSRSKDDSTTVRAESFPSRGIRAKMTVLDVESDESNSKLWATLNFDCPSLVSAKLTSSGGDKVHSVWSQRDVISSQKRFFASSHILSQNGGFASSTPVEISDSNGLEYFYSPSRKRYLKFTTKSRQNGGASGSLFAEVWAVEGGLEKVWEIESSTHGPVFSDEWFGSASWSPDESMVVYTADRPTAPPADDRGKDKYESWTDPLRFRFHENARDPFGEAYIGKRAPTLFVADLIGGTSFQLLHKDAGDLERKILGDPCWSPDGKYIVASMRRATDAIDPEEGDERVFLPPDLGLRYCYNRMSSIVLIEAPKSREELKGGSRSMQIISNAEDPDDYCCNSARFSPSGEDIIYLSAPRHKDPTLQGKVLPHNTTKILRAVSFRGIHAALPRTLISVPANPSHSDFPGLYMHSLPVSPWLDSNTIVFTTAWGSVNKVFSTSFPRKNGDLAQAPGGLKLVDWGSFLSHVDLKGQCISKDDNVSVVDVCESALLFAVNNPVTPTVLFVVRDWEKDGPDHSVTTVSQVGRRAKNMNLVVDAMRTVDLVLQDETNSGTAKEYDATVDDPEMRYQVTVILPKSEISKRPFIVYPHGGPHVTTLNGFSVGAAALLKRGFAVMYVNYRGSLGFGQKLLETLPGNVGTQDVNEVAQATRWALEHSEFRLDVERVGFLGGSHSGFIGAHTSLIPGLFKRTVLRNPVVNIATMVGASDIPDWCFCEANVGSKNRNGLRYAADAEQMRVMYEHSPISRVKPISDTQERPGPTLLQVGGSDRRVPPQQSLEWKRIMTQAYGEDNVAIRWYPDSGHAIDEVPNGDDAWVHSLDFICQI